MLLYSTSSTCFISSSSNKLLREIICHVIASPASGLDVEVTDHIVSHWRFSLRHFNKSFSFTYGSIWTRLVSTLKSQFYSFTLTVYDSSADERLIPINTSLRNSTVNTEILHAVTLNRHLVKPCIRCMRRVWKTNVGADCLVPPPPSCDSEFMLMPLRSTVSDADGRRSKH